MKGKSEFLEFFGGNLMQVEIFFYSRFIFNPRQQTWLTERKQIKKVFVEIKSVEFKCGLMLHIL